MIKPLMSLRNFFITEDTQGQKLKISEVTTDTQQEEKKPDDEESEGQEDSEEESQESTTEGEQSQATSQAQLTTMTARATKAEDNVTQLTTQVASLTKERDHYKAWFDKSADKGKSLPDADASDRGETSTYNSHAQQVWKESH